MTLRLHTPLLVRTALSSVFFGSALAMLWLGAIASDYLLYQSGGALAVVLLLLGGVFAGGAAWQYSLVVRRSPFSLRETLWLSPLLLLLVVPLSLATGAYSSPLFVFALALLLGIAPSAISVASERTS